MLQLGLGSCRDPHRPANTRARRTPHASLAVPDFRSAHAVSRRRERSLHPWRRRCLRDGPHRGRGGALPPERGPVPRGRGARGLPRVHRQPRAGPPPERRPAGGGVRGERRPQPRVPDFPRARARPPARPRARRRRPAAPGRDLPAPQRARRHLRGPAELRAGDPARHTPPAQLPAPSLDRARAPGRHARGRSGHHGRPGRHHPAAAPGPGAAPAGLRHAPLRVQRREPGQHLDP